MKSGPCVEFDARTASAIGVFNFAGAFAANVALALANSVGHTVTMSAASGATSATTSSMRFCFTPAHCSVSTKCVATAPK